MARYTIVTMPGDGIGNEVLPEALRVLGAVGLDAEYAAPRPDRRRPRLEPAYPPH
jgi:isocitrate/isopropylmalate dehydrogenase